jgi:hypothetical protein
MKKQHILPAFVGLVIGMGGTSLFDYYSGLVDVRVISHNGLGTDYTVRRADLNRFNRWAEETNRTACIYLRHSFTNRPDGAPTTYHNTECHRIS